MADLKDFGVVKSWYEAYKQVNEKKEPEVKVLPKDDDEEKEKKPEPKATDDADSLKAENEKLKAEVEKLKLDVAKKDAETNVETNADTGEVPLRVGIAQSILDKKKKKEVKEELGEETLDEKIDPKLKLRYMKTVVDMLDGTHGKQVISQSDYDKLMKLTKKMNKFENPRGASSTEKKEYETLVKKYAGKLGS